MPPASINIQATSKFLLSTHSLFAMEKPSTILIEQLQSVHARQRKVIQQLQADNARLLSDLVEIRRERDAFRAEAAKLRKGQAELHNQLDETLSEYQDLRRERLTLSHTFSNASSFGRPSKANNKAMHILSALTGDEAKSPSLDYSTGMTHNSQNSYSSRELPEPVTTDEPQMDEPVRRIRKQPTTMMPVPRASLYALDMNH